MIFNSTYVILFYEKRFLERDLFLQPLALRHVINVIWQQPSFHWLLCLLDSIEQDMQSITQTLVQSKCLCIQCARAFSKKTVVWLRLYDNLNSIFVQAMFITIEKLGFTYGSLYLMCIKCTSSQTGSELQIVIGDNKIKNKKQLEEIKCITYVTSDLMQELMLWCLTPLSTIFQLYRGRDRMVVGFTNTYVINTCHH